MKSMGLNELRTAYLEFFKSKEHLVMPSAPLVPKNDNSLLLINSGMAPLKPYFTGVQKPPKNRVSTCQKCIRTGDIENVGKTSRHGTFFEMLGNFSFGDYFKGEVIPWAWEFITQVLKIEKDKLYVTIYLEDDEAFDIWTSKTDVDPSRIFRLGKDDNFWEIGVGPCGPCSEIHFDRDVEAGVIKTTEEFLAAADIDRIVEFWNLVFTQFDRDEAGNYNRLQYPNIDTGMGLERIATIMQGVDNIFEVDTMQAVIDTISKLTGVKYKEDKLKDVSIRIITDHIRGVTFMVGDDILPSNEGRGYVLRRLLRRAARHGKLLGLNGSFLTDLCDVVIANYGEAYKELQVKKDYIKKVIKLEEERFMQTIDAGIVILKDYIEELEKRGSTTLDGAHAFKLYDTYGFPIELTQEIVEEKGLSVDLDGFKKEMDEQRKRAREAREESNYMGSDDTTASIIPSDLTIEFTGYEKLEDTSDVLFIIKNNESVNELSQGEEGLVILNKTPFYAEMGGQIGDTGLLKCEGVKVAVTDCKKSVSGKVTHTVKVIEGTLSVGATVNAKVEVSKHKSICRNHTATHMLQSALKNVLGSHVAQAGSYVTEERLRFDFTHFSALSTEELQKVEDVLNNAIMQAMDVVTEEMSPKEAMEKGAMALFEDKYGDVVRVVSVCDYSVELCGGTHVKNTGEIGMFKILSETGVAAGVRRIEAITGVNTIAYLKNLEGTMDTVGNTLKASRKDVVSKVSSLVAELKNKDKEILELKNEIAKNAQGDILNNVKEVNGVNLVAAVLDNMDTDSLRALGDRLKDSIENSVVVLGTVCNEKIALLAMASKDAIAKGAHSGKIIKEVAAIVGGGGGGRPDMAQAGGKNPEKLNEAIEKVEEILKNIIK